METLIDKVQEHLLNEFAKRGVKMSWQLMEADLEAEHLKLRLQPDTLKISEITSMMQWLELKSIKVDKFEIIAR